MRVRLLVSRVGPGGFFDPGHVIDVPPQEAAALLNSAQAEIPEPAASAPESTAIEPAAEHAVRPDPEGRPRGTRARYRPR